MFLGGVIIFVKKMGVNWILMDEIGVMDTQLDPSDPKQTFRPHQTSENSLAR